MPHPPTIFDTLAAPLIGVTTALLLAALALSLRATVHRRRGPVADVLEEGAPNAGEVDVLVLVDLDRDPSATPTAATRVLGPRIRRLTLGFLTGSTPAGDESERVEAAVAPVEVFRPAVLVVHGDAGPAATRLARMGAYDTVVVSEDFDVDTAATVARSGTPVLRVKEPDRPAVPPALTARGSRS